MPVHVLRGSRSLVSINEAQRQGGFIRPARRRPPRPRPAPSSPPAPGRSPSSPRHRAPLTDALARACHGHSPHAGYSRAIGLNSEEPINTEGYRPLAAVRALDARAFETSSLRRHEHRGDSGDAERMLPPPKRCADRVARPDHEQSLGQRYRSSRNGLHVPSPQWGNVGSQVSACGGQNGRHRPQQSGSAQPARESRSVSSVAN